MARRKKKIDYISAIDKLFMQWKKESKPSASQQHEIEKHARVAALRDHPEDQSSR